MDALRSNWVVWSGVVVMLIAAAIVFVRFRRGRETPTLVLVRRRRELMAQLEELAGDTGPASVDGVDGRVAQFGLDEV